MPQAVENCVSSLTAKWKKDPASRPKPKQAGQDAKSQAFAICQESQKAQQAIETVMLEGVGPVILGVAATNRPHLPLPPISIVEKDGKQYIRTPMIAQGIYRHPKGDLIFNQATVDRMLANHKAGISHFGVSLDAKHLPQLGALAWYDEKSGGWLAEEEENGEKLVVGYGVPTGNDALEAVKSGKFKFASIEFHPNYESDVIERLSSDDLNILTLEQFLQEVSMEKNENGTILLSADEAKVYEETQNSIKAFETQVKDLTAKLEVAEAKVVKLESSVETETDDLPEAIRLQLEERDKKVAAMQKRLLQAEVGIRLEKAKSYVDEMGRAHSPVLLEWAEKVMTGAQLGDEQTVIKLELGGEGQYIFEAVGWLLDNLPGQMPVKGNTEEDEYRLEHGGDGTKNYTKEDFQNFWKSGGGE